MILPAEEIKRAILNPDAELREAAVFYFARSMPSDPSIMPAVVEACGRYGPEAFQSYFFLWSLTQTDDSVAWLIQQIERFDAAATDEDAHRHLAALVSALRRADTAVLKPHADALERMQQLDDASKTIIEAKLRLSHSAPETLWQELTDFCDRHDQDEETPQDEYELGCSIADALSAFPDQCSARVLEIVQTGEQIGSWLEVMAARLAGRLGLDEAIPSLVDFLEDPESWVHEEALWALKRMGNDSVVSEIRGQYETDDEGLRITFAYLLGDIHTDLSAQTCLKLFHQEQDPEIRAILLRSALTNFSSDAIEPARQYVLTTPKDPGVIDVRRELLVASKMLGVALPEFAAWTADIETDAEFIREWYKTHSRFDFDSVDDPWGDDEFEEGEFEDGGFDEGDFGEDDFGDVPEDTIVRHERRVGRNDPCPCGSGKKYKKCCYGKESEPKAQPTSAPVAQPRPARSSLQFPIGTVALYGPDDKTTTKIVAAAISSEGAEPVLERWVGTNLEDSPKVQREMQAFFRRHRVQRVALTDRNMGCPHEEGLDFPEGGDCPFCPFWAGKQGSGANRS